MDPEKYTEKMARVGLGLTNETRRTAAEGKGDSEVMSPQERDGKLAEIVVRIDAVEESLLS